jgi:hypothetical protein
MKIKILHEHGNEYGYNQWGMMLKYYENTSIILAEPNDNKDIDYYIIINSPPCKDTHYISNKTILILDEPKEFLTSSDGISRSGFYGWKEKHKFLKVLDHKNALNNVRWQMNKIPEKIVKSALPSKKYKLDRICSILGSKHFDPGHILRVEFVKKMERYFNDDIIDIYGYKNYHNLKYYKSPLPNDDKAIVSNYKYYFMCENNVKKNYATEKIWEPIICETLCFYWGCPNLEDYIDPKSFVRLDMNDMINSLKIIERAIKEDWWSQRIDIIRKMKTKILNELAFFPTIERIIKKHTNKIKA